MFFRRPKKKLSSVEPIIEVFVRHTSYSKASCHKKRPDYFDKIKCHENLLKTKDERVRLHYLLDVAHSQEHFLQKEAIPIFGGSEALSFLKLLDYVIERDFHPNTIIYFLEDDYLHRPGWVQALFEGFSLGADYITLYDHKDKYLSYPKLKSKIYATSSCHWRTTPSTTNTYAMLFQTLQQHLPIHRRFSENRKISADHEKFCFLAKKGAELISALPGFSTHVDAQYASPCVDWSAY